jgi:alpha,alpha-trehalase
MRTKLPLAKLTCFFALCLIPAATAPRQEPVSSARPQELQDILRYISNGWNVLTRSMSKCEDVSDPKSPEASVIYFPADLSIPSFMQKLTRKCRIRAQHLPSKIERLGDIGVVRIRPQGLLYLANPYVVPGGMFNEMYGWDSYFILRGLLRAGRLDLARGMVENFLFEIDHYGGILNANRTYYLTRSQPPFLTSMIMAVHEAEQSRKQDDRDWLAKAYLYAVKDYGLWMRDPHLAGSTGLSRYYDMGEGPVPELGQGAAGYFGQVVRYFLRHPADDGSFLSKTQESTRAASPLGPQFVLDLCESGDGPGREKGCEQVENVGLTADFYKGDRSMRESGFDVSFRFGPYSAGTHHYAPVCLNSLLYKEEKDLEQLSTLLGREREAGEWRQRAQRRRDAITKYLWNEQRGLFFDYNFETQTQSSYVYATTFYPLWAGLASPEQARAVAGNLNLLEQPGGLAMSQRETGAQWDYPYGWAPVHLLAVEGLRTYGYEEKANRLSFKFLSTVLKNFRRDGTIREKYNVVTGSSETHVEAGYSENVIGFGWTNGVFLELLHALPEKWASRLSSDE